MKTFKRIFVFLLVLIVGFSVYIATRPGYFNFERSKLIDAPRSVLFDKVNDFKNWPQFSPWLEQEPEAMLSYADITSGQGASYSWKGDLLGEGSMQTYKVKKDTRIEQGIDFIKPFEASSKVNWSFEPQGSDTKVTWQMEGEQDFVSKLFSFFMGSIEDMTGPDFERGLHKLDSIVQKDMSVYSIKVNGVIEHGGGYYLYRSTSCRFSEFQSVMQQLMPELAAYALSNDIRMSGKPFVIYHKWDEANDAVIFSACIPTSTKMISSEPNILTGQLEPFKAVKTTLTGDYKNLEEAWETTMSFMNERNLELLEDGTMLETYVIDPASSPNPAKWITELFAEIN